MRKATTFRLAVCCVCLSAAAPPVWAQVGYRTLSNRGSVYVKEESYFGKPLYIVDAPTAGLLRPGDFRANVRIYENGGVVAGLSAGVSNHVMFGVSYGGTQIIGDSQQINWNPMPGIHLNYRIWDESLRLPALTLGFDSQGVGPYYSERNVHYPYVNGAESDSLNRYSFKSRGFFLVVSKGYATFINMGLHAGVSYSLDKGGSAKRSPTLYMAANAGLARDLAILAEYDFAVHDSAWYSRGIVNVGLRWAFSGNIFFDFNLQNALGKREGKSDVRRVINLSYYGSVVK